MSDAVKPLRILLFCIKFAVGGIQRHAIELGTWLRARPHDHVCRHARRVARC
jgi:hypothetical protein